MVQINEENIAKDPQNLTDRAYTVVRVLNAISFLLSLFLLSFVIFLIKNKLSKKAGVEKKTTQKKDETVKDKKKNE